MKQIELTQGSIVKSLILFALPLMAGNGVNLRKKWLTPFFFFILTTASERLDIQKRYMKTSDMNVIF